MRIYFLVLVLFWNLCASPALARDALFLASRENTPTNRFAEQVLAEAYARLGVGVIFIHYPSARSIVEANAGRVDGEVARLGSVLGKYTNLRKVPVTLFHSELSVFRRRQAKFKVVDWQSLDGLNLTTIRGFKYVEGKLANLSPVIVDGTEKAINLVEYGRIDAAVLNEFMGRLAIAKTKAQNVDVVRPPLDRLPVYHLLHKNHESLIPKLTSILRQMEERGEIQEMWDQFAIVETQKASGVFRHQGPKVYILNTSTVAPYSTPRNTGFQDMITAEIFRRIGLEARVRIYQASARALISANKNIDQGVAMRIKGLEKKYPNLVRIDEPLISNDFVAYSKGINFPTDDWKSLEPHTVGYINGWVIFEKNLAAKQRKVAVTKPEQMFKMLEKDRVDLVLYERWQGLQLARDANMDVSVHMPPLASVKMYMYVHKEYAHLAPLLEQALRDMKSDGTYQAIFDRTLTPLEKSPE